MPIARFQLPDGRVARFEVPDGTTPEQAQEMMARAMQPQRRELAPEDTPGVGETLLIGAGRTFDRIGKGMQQLYHGVRGDDAALAKLKAEAASDDEAYAPLRDARPWATGIGESLPSAVIPGGGATTLLGNAGRMALAGALPGMLEYGDAGDRLKRGAMGAAAGAAFPFAMAGLKSAKSLLEPLWQGGRDAIAGRALNAAAGSDAPAVAARMASAKQIVPGSAPTAAQVAESGGIAAMERSAASANPQAYTQRAMEQASARMNALRGIAGDDAMQAAAAHRRSVIGGKAYDRAMASGIDQGMADALKPQIASLLERDSIKGAVAKARSLAKEEGIELGDNMGSVQGLQYLKQALDDAIADLPKGSNTARVWGKTSSDLKSVLQDIAPDLRRADAVYARLSRPVNRMQVGQALLDTAQPALADFGALGAESGAMFGRAMRNADATAAKALGRPGAKMADVLSADQMNAALAVAQDLARKSNAQNLGRGVGSNTFQNFAMANIAEQSGMPRAVGGLLNIPGISRATNWLYRETDQKVKEALSDALLDPKRAAELMQRADRKWLHDNPMVRQALEQAALRPAGLLSMMAATPAIQE